MEDNLDQLGEMLKSIGKRLGKKAGKQLLKLLAPLLPYIIIVILIVSFVLMLIAATYGAMPQGGTLTGVQGSTKDAKFKAAYKRIAYEYNNDNTWDVTQSIIVGSEKNGEPAKQPYYSGQIKYGRKYLSLYPGKKVKVASGYTLPSKGDHSDVLQRDYPQGLTWGIIHAMNLYYTYNYNTTLSQREINVLGKLMRPHFYYKPSVVITVTTRTVTTKTKKGTFTSTSTSTSNLYRWLLVEAYTIRGHYEYFYKWKTITRSGRNWSETTTEEVPTKVVNLHSQRFLRIINQVFQMNYTSESTEYQLLAESIRKAGTAFTSGSQNMQWLLQLATGGGYVGTPVMVTDADIKYQPIKNMPAVIAFLKKYHSALTRNNYLSDLNQIGAEHNMNPLFLLAVTGAEQSFVPTTYSDWKDVIQNPFNVTDGNGPGSWQTYRPGFDTSAEIAAQTLANDSLGCPSGWNVVEWIEGFEPDGSQRPKTSTYLGRYAAGYQEWINNVTRFYAELKSLGD